MARSILEQLVVELSTDNTKLTSGLQQAERQTQTTAQRLGANARAIGVATAAVATAVAAVGTAYIAAANRAAGYADEVDKAALRTRLSRQSVQELRFVTDQLGGSFGTVETAVVGLTQRLAGAEQGSERQTEAFKRLGISTRDANGNLRATEDILFDSISALQGVENETQRAVLAQEVFGRSASQLGPILAAGAGSVDELRSKANELGLVLDDQSIGSLVQYKDQLSQVQQQFGAVSRELVLSFLPVLTDKLLPAVETGLRLFRDLPGPVRDTGVAMSAAGIGLTAAAVAARALGVALTPLTGTVGLLALVTVGVATLAGEVLNANPALDAQKDAVRELKEEYERYRGQLVVTSEAERQAAIDRLNVLRGEIQARIALLAQLASQERDQAAGILNNPIVRFLLPGFIDVQPGARQGTLAEIERLSGTLNSLNLDQFLLQSGANTLVPPPPGAGAPPPPAGGGAGGTTPSNKPPPRTVLDVFTELGDAGATLNRIAAFNGNTPEALLAAAEGRFRLLDGAAKELLTDFADKVTEAELQNIRERRDRVVAEIGQLRLGIERAVEAPSDIAFASALDAPLTAAQRTLELELGRLINSDDLEALLNPKVERANSDIVGISEGIDLGPLGSAARREADRLSLLIGQGEEGLRNALDPTFARDQDFAARVAASTGARFIGDPALARDATASVDEIGTAFANLNARGGILADTIRSLVDAGAPAEEVRDAFDALLRVSGRLPPELVETYMALQGLLAVAAEGSGALRRSGNRISGPLAPSAFRDGRPGEQRGAGEKGATLGALPLVFDTRVLEQNTNERVERALEDAARRQQESADAFANTVVQSSFSFANGIIDSIRNGDIGQAFSSALSAASGIVGAGNFGNLSILGGAVPIASLLAGAIGLVGNLFGGLFGGGRGRDAVASRAAGANVRGAPAISINLTQNVSLAVASLVGAEARQAFDRANGDLLRLIETNVLPRLGRLEAAT